MTEGGKNIAVIGTTGSIGKAFVEALAVKRDTQTLHAIARKQQTFDHPNVIPHQIDISEEQNIERLPIVLSAKQPLDLIVVATGLLHKEDVQPEKSLKDLNKEKFQTLFESNTIIPALLAKYLLPCLNKQRRSLFACLSARVGSISDNQLGGWYAYRASKAALNMVMKNASIEIARKNKQAIVITLHPGTVDSDLSKPFQARVNPENLFTPAHAVSKMLDVIENVAYEETGCFFAYDGQKIEF